MEVLAKRYNRILWLHTFYILSGAGLVTGGGFLLKQSLPAAVVLFLMGGVLLFFGVFLTALALRTPNEAVRHDGKNLYFPDFSCRVTDPFEVSFTTPAKESYGTLYVRAGGKERKYRFVADVEQVCAALKAIKKRSKKSGQEER